MREIYIAYFLRHSDQYTAIHILTSYRLLLTFQLNTTNTWCYFLPQICYMFQQCNQEAFFYIAI